MQATTINIEALELEIEILLSEGYTIEDILNPIDGWTEEKIQQKAYEIECDREKQRIFNLLEDLQMEFGGKYSSPKWRLKLRIADHKASFSRVCNDIDTVYSFVVSESRFESDLKNEWDITKMSLSEAIDFINEKIDEFEEEIEEEEED